MNLTVITKKEHILIINETKFQIVLISNLERVAENREECPTTYKKYSRHNIGTAPNKNGQGVP